MSIEDTLDEFNLLTKEIFSESNLLEDGMLDDEKLEVAVKKLVKKYSSGNENEGLLEDPKQRKCKVCVPSATVTR